MLGTTELLLLGALALLVFGGKKVPEMMKGLGQGVKEFKKGMKDDENNSSLTNDIESSNENNNIHSSLEDSENQFHANKQ